MNSIADNIRSVRQRIKIALKKARREDDHILLLAISKKKSSHLIRKAFAAGIREFGENYVQEAIQKREELSDLDLSWHFTGPIQSNKTKYIANGFSWVHSVDRLKIAQRLSEQRSAEQSPLNVCIQVNINDEHSKSGVAVGDLPELARLIYQLPRLRLRGLMCIPAASQTLQERQATFARMRNLQQTLASEISGIDTLSMGMSGDLELAVTEGATIVRVGTAIFGQRETA